MRRVLVVTAMEGAGGEEDGMLLVVVVVVRGRTLLIEWLPPPSLWPRSCTVTDRLYSVCI